jgi:hypothetical protein
LLLAVVGVPPIVRPANGLPCETCTKPGPDGKALAAVPDARTSTATAAIVANLPDVRTIPPSVVTDTDRPLHVILLRRGKGTDGAEKDIDG